MVAVRSVSLKPNLAIPVELVVVRSVALNPNPVIPVELVMFVMPSVYTNYRHLSIAGTINSEKFPRYSKFVRRSICYSFAIGPA